MCDKITQNTVLYTMFECVIVECMLMNFSKTDLGVCLSVSDML